MRNIIIGIFFVSAIQSCTIKISRRMDKDNPTSYVFSSNIVDVKGIIVKKMGHYQYRGMSLYKVGDKNGCIVSKGVLCKEPNINDFYLYSFESNMGKTKKYRSIWGCLKYEASFHIHLDSISTQQTRVTINTIEPEIRRGYKFKRGDNNSLIKPKYESIEPTTIEEYEILLLVGEGLNKKDMPSLILP